MVTVYGASDDLVELEGDIREEFSWTGAADEEEDRLLAFSNGLVLRIRYADPGVWRINEVVPVPREGVTIQQAPENDEDNYSDRAVVEGAISWVVFGSQIAFARPPK